MAEVKTAAPAKQRKSFDDRASFAKGSIKHFGPDHDRQDSAPSELANLNEREAMLVAKTKRIEGMDAAHLARNDIDINTLKQRNARQLAEVRMEIVRLSPK